MSWLIYLLEVACCHFLFWLVYRLFFQKLSSFQWNRVYLVATVLISFFIPVLEIPIYNAIAPSEVFTWNLTETSNVVSQSSEEFTSAFNWYAVIPVVILSIYLVGVLYFIGGLILSISKVLKLVRNNQVDIKSDVQLIRIPQNTRFFTFWRWVFVSNTDFIDEKSQALILSHEKAHVDHWHTLDVVLMELVSALCWFNPFIYFIKSDLRLIHEYQADEATMAISHDVDQYSRLMLSLACSSSSQGITHSFSKQNLKKRIMMINTQKSNAQSLWRYALVLPVLLLAGLLFSCTHDKTSDLLDSDNSGPIINSISWTGNTKYGDVKLTKLLGIQEGKSYSSSTLDNIQKLVLDESDITSLYMNSGYLFFHIEPTIINRGKTVDLVFKIEEGPEVTVGKVCVNGGDGEEMLNSLMSLVELKPGSLFDRGKLIQSQSQIAKSGYVKPDAVNVMPKPRQSDDQWFVDIDFNVEVK